MFERFTERARAAMSLAHERAIRLGHEAIASEHVFMVLLADETDLPARAVQNLGVDPSALAERVADLLPRLDPSTADTPLPFTSCSKRMLEAALADAQRRGRAHIGTTHLFVGALVSADTILRRSRIRKALAASGVALAEARGAVDRIRDGEPDPPRPE